MLLMIIKRTERSAVERSQAKKIYKSPSMNCYGTVRELTQGGGTGPSESAKPQDCVDILQKSNVNCSQ
jgi:hypothetical protein